jgi:hypothetical protein
MTSAVAGQKKQPSASDGAGDDRVGRGPEWGRHRQFFHVGQTLELVEPASSDDAECSLHFAHLV